MIPPQVGGILFLVGRRRGEMWLVTRATRRDSAALMLFTSFSALSAFALLHTTSYTSTHLSLRRCIESHRMSFQLRQLRPLSCLNGDTAVGVEEENVGVVSTMGVEEDDAGKAEKIEKAPPLSSPGEGLEPSSAEPKPTLISSKKELKEVLREYRNQQSAPLNKPAYTIFTNASLDGILKQMPRNRDALLEVKGIGPKKLEMFGDDILTILARYTGGEVVADDSGDGTSTGAPIRRPVAINRASLTEEQSRAADLALDEGQSIFLTGAAGTGKSHLLKYIVQQLEARNRNYAVCAPTGVAAINVGGSTLNSFFGIGFGTGSLPNLIKKVAKNKDAVERMDRTDVLCIDECSMLSSYLLETLDHVVRRLRRNGTFADEPFGGMQVIAVGDFFQLPPIYKAQGRGYDDDGDMDRDRSWRPFCFDSPVWSDLGLLEHKRKFELKEVQRQDKNSRFVAFLNKVRVGDIDERIIQDFNAKCMISPAHPLPTDGIVPTRLYILNKDVDAENESRLAELDSEEVICMARDEWRESMPTGTLASVKKNMKDSIGLEMPDEVCLKVGAQVMLTRNKDLKRGLVNGSRGVVERFVEGSDGGPIPVVRFDSGRVLEVKKVEAVRYNPQGGPGCLVRRQIPLKLAWAVTVHKSQGTTLTRALLDISSAFEYGQCYVALSRVRTIDGLWLERPAKLHNIMVSPQVMEYYNMV